ncbi:hypothetical protein JW926_00595 [Candidatus Sumerlaeota bacterium]|nr:hypothetical protein [Candidatus Sumerlaeota bacterium]
MERYADVFHVEKREIKSNALAKLFFPQEFKTIVEMQGYFEMVGFFERDSARPIHDVKSDNIVLLRKKLNLLNMY